MSLATLSFNQQISASQLNLYQVIYFLGCDDEHLYGCVSIVNAPKEHLSIYKIRNVLLERYNQLTGHNITLNDEPC